ncbi:hypothetical protein [Alicyclobacillus macrosporangiidus]|jgi:hypothetical protein|uniref:Uncharacterized protein n=1 Tax=Alicyclobacillus macrosporangiidus TaxID=392015 RepID=A0A1I7FW14_9BACL|nr:hypothetical protein [Alicyclobacillus macrosporangiidus]SFU40378.1 hypothetical protein SAMN05421543_101480 [Alicyclobacillus macrosporangiidus]
MPGLNVVTKNLDRWVERKRAASLALAKYWAMQLEGEMKQNRPWQDRTGNARAGLKGSAELNNEGIAIRLAHSVDYGVFLELAHDGRYAILRPTRNARAQDVRRSFQELWR